MGIRRAFRQCAPMFMCCWIRRQRKLSRRLVTSRVRFGTLRTVRPTSSVFGFNRGLPIDRYFIESFLRRWDADIHGTVLEVGGRDYTLRFGGSRVCASEVLHVEAGNAQATIVGDLATGTGIPGEAFDCMILTQTFHFIYDVQSAIVNSCGALKPRGVLLATFPGISQISRYDMDRWGDYWRFTTLSAKRLFEEVFPPGNVEVRAYGNVLTALALLHGLAAEELQPHELEYHDPDYQVLITVRAVK